MTTRITYSPPPPLPPTSRLTALLLQVILNEWLSLLLRILDIHWSCVLTMLFGCYMAGAAWNCCHLDAHSVYTIQACTMSCHFMQSRIRRVHAHLVVTFHMRFWQNGQDLFMCYCGNMGLEWTPKQESAQKADPREENSPATPAWTFNQRLYDHEIGTLTTELCPLPNNILFFLQYSSLSQETAPQISSVWMETGVKNLFELDHVDVGKNHTLKTTEKKRKNNSKTTAFLFCLFNALVRPKQPKQVQTCAHFTRTLSGSLNQNPTQQPLSMTSQANTQHGTDYQNFSTPVKQWQEATHINSLSVNGGKTFSHSSSTAVSM